MPYQITIKRLFYFSFFLLFFLIGIICQPYERAANAQTNETIPFAPPRQKTIGQPYPSPLDATTPTGSLQSGRIQSAPTISSGTEASLVEGQIERSAGPVNILFLLDCSFSMKEKMSDGVQKIEAAKQVLQNALARIPSDVNIGLRVFGQNGSSGTAGKFISNLMGDDCQQTALLVPLGQGNRRSIIEKVRDIRAFGMTPLAYALSMAAQSDLAVPRAIKLLF